MELKNIFHLTLYILHKIMFTGIQKVAIYNPSDGTTVQLNKIAPDADVKIKSPIEIQDVSTNLYYDGDESFIEFASFDVELFYQLEAWMLAHTPVRLVAAGMEHNLLWEESVTLTVRKTYGFQPGNRNTMIVKLSKERGSHSIYAVSNLVRRLGRFIDANTNEKADNISFIDDGGTYAFDDSIFNQQYTGAGGQGMVAAAVIDFPISGITIYAKMNQKVQSPSQAWTFKLEALNFASSVITSVTVSNADDVLSLLLPAATFRVRIKIEVTGSNNVRFYIPYVGMQRGTYLNINY